MQREGWLVAAAGAVLAACAIVGARLLKDNAYQRARLFPTQSEVVLTQFAEKAQPSREDYSTLVAYFTEGFLSYATPLRANATYPGYVSGNGRQKENLEGFSRNAPLMAAWLRNSPTNSLRLPSGTSVDVARLLGDAVTVGTDPNSKEYWGAIESHDQRVVEAADVALTLWLAREKVWNALPVEARQRAVDWLLGVNGKQVVDNNWHLFIAQINVILKALGERHDEQEIAQRLQRVKTFYRDDGWFADGPTGPVDYYNAWGFYYHLHWIHIVDSSVEADFIVNGTARFAGQLLQLIGPEGFPIMGRSVCYRLGVTAPLVFAAEMESVGLDAGQARRALDATWQYFIRHGAVKQGRVTQGYCGDDPRILDDYSGPASCLWSLRSLIAAMYYPEDSRFWQASPKPLPVEIGDIQTRLESANLQLIGKRETGEIMLINPSGTDDAPLLPYTWKDRLKERLFGDIRRPSNEQAKYHRSHYSSQQPFCGCPGPLEKSR